MTRDALIPEMREKVLMSDLDRALDDAEREIATADFVLLTVKEYATQQRVHVQTVYTAIRQGRLRYGRVIRITDDVIRIAVPRGSITDRISA
jgi:exosome complex RNA-binding protein Rrp4